MSEFERGAEHERARIRRMLTELFDRLEVEMIALESTKPPHGGRQRQQIAAKSHVQEGVALARWELDQLQKTGKVVHWMNEGEVSPVSACGVEGPGRLAVEFGDVTCEGCRTWLEQYGGIVMADWTNG